MVFLEFEPGAKGWKAQTNPLSFHGPMVPLDMSSVNVVTEIL